LDVRTIVATLDAQPDAGEDGARLDAGGGEGVQTRQSRGKTLLFTGLQLDDLDFRVERLTERGEDVDLAEASGVRRQRCERQRGREHRESDRSTQVFPHPVLLSCW